MMETNNAGLSFELKVLSISLLNCTTFIGLEHLILAKLNHISMY